ncbi:MAG: 50S ribosomal protein L6 [Nevskiales bacterium]
MSRVAKQPINLPQGVQVNVSGQTATVKGGKGELKVELPSGISLKIENNIAQIVRDEKGAATDAMGGTLRALLAGMVEGVTRGYERKLELVGVGYRAQAQGKVLNLQLGLSHPIAYPVPAGISIETPSQTEVVIRGADKQRVGQVAADIRGFRSPEPYKGKGVRYSKEQVVLKEAKKK